MTLYELLTNIQNLGEINHIGSSFIGDIYELNHRQDIEYPAFVITQGTHQIDNDNETNIYNLSLFLVDRLTEDKSNEKDIHSWGVSGINSIIKAIEATGISYQIRNQNIDTFTEKFNSLCAGAYANLYITIDQSCCCNEPNLVTSVNGQTGDVFIKGIEGGYVESVNGKNGKVTLDIPTKTSELENDSDFAINTDVEQKVNEAKEESISYTDERVNSLSDIEYNHYREIQGIFGQVGTDIEDLKSKDNLQDEELAKKIGEAPLDGSLYVRQNGDWESIYPPMIDAPSDYNDYVRKNGEWKEITYNKNFYFSNLWFDEDDEKVKYDNAVDLGDTVFGSYQKVLVIKSRKYLSPTTYTEDRIPCTFCGTMKDNQERQFTFIHNKQMYYCTLTPQKITTEKVIIEGSVTTEEFETYKTEQGERFDQVDAEIEATNTYISRVEENKQDVLVSGQNIKTVNGESLIGEGNIEIKGGIDPEVLDSKMDKLNPTFSRDLSFTTLNPDYRLNILNNLTVTVLSGTYRANTVERYHTTSNIRVGISLFDLKQYLLDSNISDGQYIYFKAFVKDYALGSAYYTASISGRDCSQYFDDTHILGSMGETINVTGDSYGVVDSRDPFDDVRKQMVFPYTGNYYIRGGVTYGVPNSMEEANIYFSSADNAQYPTFATPFNIRQCMEDLDLWSNPPSSVYLEIYLYPNSIANWCIMATKVYTSTFDHNEFLITKRVAQDYDLVDTIDELNESVDGKQDTLESGVNIKTINGNDILGEGNIEIQSGEPYDDTEIRQEIAEVKEKVDEIELVKTPNVTIFGNPTIQNGQVSNFTNENYLQFPFLVDFKGKDFSIDFSFTTGSSLSGQQNILDSNYGIAFAIRDGHIVFVASDNGTDWNSGEQVSTNTVEPNTTYYFRLYGQKSPFVDNVYMLMLYGGQDKEFGLDSEFILSTDLTTYPYPRQIVIGRSWVENGNHFVGSINLNDANLTYITDTGSEIVWKGMDDVGLSTRLSTDMANIDTAGVAYINQMIANIFDFDEETGVLNITTV